jgi:carboxyl-terminal processing protease
LYRISGQTAQQRGVVPDVVLPDLLQADGEREEYQPNVIPANAIEANKYYKPLVPLNLQAAATAGNQAVTANDFFLKVQAYKDRVKSKKLVHETSLNLAAAIQAMKAPDETAAPLPGTVKPPYVVNNVALDNERIKADKDVEEMTTSWKAFLLKDPYLQATYQVMLSMIK